MQSRDNDNDGFVTGSGISLVSSSFSSSPKFALTFFPLQQGVPMDIG